MESSGDRLELAEVIGALRDSLATAQAQGRTATGPKFRVDNIEVEVTVEIAREYEGGAGIKFWVVQAGGKVTGSSTQTHRVLLTLKTPENYDISSHGAAVWQEERSDQS